MTAAILFRALRNPTAAETKTNATISNAQCLVYAAEQTIESDAEADENHVPDQIAEDRQTKHRLVRQDVVGGGGGVAANDEFARNIKHAERRHEDDRQIDGASDARGL